MEKIFRDLRACAGNKTVFIVGGWLRDRLLKRPTRDLDLIVGGNPLPLARTIARRLHGRLVVLDDVNRIYRIVLREHPALDYIDLARMKGKTIDEDLANRDFTINTMALPLPEKGLPALSRRIDPRGGARDAARKTVRMVSPHAFADDPLRLLRAFRLAAELGFTIDGPTLRCIARSAGLIRATAGERVRDELFRILSVNNAASWIVALEKAHLLEELVPEITRMKSSARRFYYHPHGLWQHAVETLRSLEDILAHLNRFFPGNAKKIDAHLDEPIASGITRRRLLKLIALLHDVAKPHCAQRIGNRMRFLGHETEGAAMAAKIFERLRIGRKETKIAKHLIEHHMRPISLGQARQTTRRAAMRLFRDIGKDVPDLFLLSLADCYSYRHLKVKKTVGLRKQECTVRSLVSLYFAENEKPVRPKLLDGHQLMLAFGLKPGPLIGDLLRIVEEARDLDAITTRDEALALVKKKLTPLKKRYKIAE